MAGNRALYDRAMEQSREAARQQQWDEALKQAIRAYQEFPQDLDARSSAAVALFNTGKYAQALQLLEELRRSDPNNPFFLEHIAHTHERLGDMAAAVTDYTQLADLQENRRLLPRAIEALREVLRLNPNADDARARLARSLEQAGLTADAVSESLDLARRHRSGDPHSAIAFAETAVRLDPANREAKELVAALSADLAGEIGATTASNLPTSDPFVAAMAGGTGALRGGTTLALDKVVALAQEHQEAGDISGAIEMYERAMQMGTVRPDVCYSLGMLYQQSGDHARAVDLLGRAMSNDYALSAHFARGSSFEQLGDLPHAAQEYEQTIALLPLATIGKSESEDMIEMYERASRVYVSLGDPARAASLYAALATFLGSKRWGRERADEFKQKAKGLSEQNMFAKLKQLGTGALRTPEPESQQVSAAPSSETWGKIRPITEFLRPHRAPTEPPVVAPLIAAEPLVMQPTLPPETMRFAPVTKLETAGLDQMAARYIDASEQYVGQGLMLAAVDACMEVIRIEPEYFPIHLRLGEIFEREGRPEQALTKYQLLIDTYTARNEPRRAIDAYKRLIDLSPDTVNARSRLAELLKNDGRNAEAAEQVAVVGSAYLRMGQTNKALEEYRRGLQWAPDSAELRAQYGQALLKLNRYENALTEFRRALDLEQSNLTHIARINIAMALLSEQPLAVWQSLQTLLTQLQLKPQQLAEVQSEYRAALNVADAPVLHYILGVLQQNASQHPSALFSFEQAAALLEDAPDRLISEQLVAQAMAESYTVVGQFEEAKLMLEHCLVPPLATAPAELAAYRFAAPLSQGELVRRLADIYADQGDLAGAERALLEAKHHLPYDRVVYTKLADVYFRQGKLSEALAQLEDLATYYESRQDLDRALQALEDAARLAPNNIAVGNRLAKLNIRRGYLDQGVEGLVKVAEQQRRAGRLKDAVANLQQAADVHWTLGKHAEARVLYDKIVQIAPNDVDARQWLAFMYTLTGKPRDAISEKKQIVRILLAQKDLDNAIAEMHQIYGLDQSDTENLFQLGDALMRRKEFEQAYRIYGRLLKMPDVEAPRIEALQSAAKRMMEAGQA